MLNKLLAVGKLALNTGTAVAKATEIHGGEAITWGADKLPDINTLNAKISALNRNYTSIPVKVVCVQNSSSDPDDYELDVDINEIANALGEGRTAKPTITIYSKFPNDLNRDLLANRLEESLKPLIQHYKDHVERRKDDIIFQREKEEFFSFWKYLDLSIIILMFPPFILVLLALDFAEAMRRLPSLILAQFTTDEIGKLDAELAEARATVKSIIRKMKIEPLP